MAIDLIEALDQRVRELEAQLAAVRSARAALAGKSTASTGGTGRKRRKLTAEQRAAISKRMKAAWARRRKQA